MLARSSSKHIPFLSSSTQPAFAHLWENPTTAMGRPPHRTLWGRIACRDRGGAADIYNSDIMSTTSTMTQALRHELCRIIQFFLKKQMKPHAVPYLKCLLLLCFVATVGDLTLSSESIGARVLFLRLVSAIVFLSKVKFLVFFFFFSSAASSASSSSSTVRMNQN